MVWVAYTECGLRNLVVEWLEQWTGIWEIQIPFFTELWNCNPDGQLLSFPLITPQGGCKDNVYLWLMGRKLGPKWNKSINQSVKQ